MKNFLMTICLVVFVLCLCGSAGAQTVIYVDASATGANNGTSWHDAYNYLRDALINLRGDEIWVAEGSYHPDHTKDLGEIVPRISSFWLCNGVSIYGGFPAGGGAWEDRDPVTYQTILTGDLYGDDMGFINNDENNYHVVRVSDVDATAVLDGFIITGGNADYPKVPPHGMGGGVYLVNSSPTITNCVFRVNFAYYGGGMYDENGSPTVTNCIFAGNQAEISGGGMGNNYSRAIVTNCLLSGNSAGSGGGMDNFGSSPTAINCTFNVNSATSYGGGIRNTASDLAVTNCIMWGNTAGMLFDEIYNDSSKPTISYSDIAGSGGSGSGWNPILGTDGGGNIDADPCFVSAPGDLHLLADSPCIDAGNNSCVTEPNDLDRNPRIINDIVDMGAYEADPADFVQRLAQAVIDLNIEHGVINGLDAKLDAALAALDDLNENNDSSAINKLEAFIRSVEQQSGDVIPVDDAKDLIAAAQAIIDLLLSE